MTATEPLLKTRQLADALGVSVSTVKRWVDTGAIRAARTVGKHRLIAMGEAIRFARERALPGEKLQALLGVKSSRVAAADEATCEELVAALKEGRAGRARELIVLAYAECKDAAVLADDLIRPAMERIGHGWEAGELGIDQEHRASRIVEAALMELNARLTRPTAASRPLALGAAPAGDPYTLSGLLCEMSLRELGWDVINFGPNLPLESLAKAVQRHRPRLVWLSVTHLEDPERFVREYRGLHASLASIGAATCLGGPALTPPLRARLVAASFGERVAHLAEFARRLVPARAFLEDTARASEPKED